MTFLAPWALMIGVAAALGTVLLHLVARQRPAAFVLPTARFVPDQRTLVSRAASTPRDVLLLALRMLLLLAASAAFARPVLVPHRYARARIVLLDRSAAVASVEEGLARVRALVAEGVPTTVIAFDSAASAKDSVLPTEEAPVVSRSTVRSEVRSTSRGSIGAALLRALRLREAITDADSVELVLVSPVAASELDAATDSIRRLWPAAIRLERTVLRSTSVTAWRLEGALRAGDPLAPAVASLRTRDPVVVARTVPAPLRGAVSRVVRRAPGAPDSAFARAGGTLVQWSDRVPERPSAQGLAAGDDVIVALLGRVTLASEGRIVARWADGSAAATERAVGDGCIRDIGVAVPAAGELPLHPAFQRMVRGLLAPCGLTVSERPADSASVAHLVSRTLPATARTSRRGGVDVPSPLVRWLLALALALALGELLVRRMQPRHEPGAESA